MGRTRCLAARDGLVAALEPHFVAVICAASMGHVDIPAGHPLGGARNHQQIHPEGGLGSGEPLQNGAGLCGWCGCRWVDAWGLRGDESVRAYVCV